MEVTTSDRDEVRKAILRLPERQRAALELREGKGLSYGQIAATLETSPGSVAQLLERARINLYDELRGTALASIAAPTAECERALPLIATRQDGELASSSEDASWLDTHLSGCHRCQLAAEQMGEAAVFCRGEAAPSAAARDATPPASTPPTGSSDLPARRRYRWSKRRAMLAGGLGALAVAGVLAALAADGDSSDTAPSAADAAGGASFVQGISDARVVQRAHKGGSRHSAKSRRNLTDVATSQTGAGGSAATPAYTPVEEADGARGGSASGPHRSAGDTAVQPAKQKSPSKAKSPPSSAHASQPTAQPASEPAPAPPPAEEPTAPTEEPGEHGHKGEPPGKPADRPPHK